MEIVFDAGRSPDGNLYLMRVVCKSSEGSTPWAVTRIKLCVPQSIVCKFRLFVMAWHIIVVVFKAYVVASRTWLDLASFLVSVAAFSDSGFDR